MSYFISPAVCDLCSFIICFFVFSLSLFLIGKQKTGGAHNSPALKLTGGLTDKPPKPIKQHSLASSNHGFYTPTHTLSTATASKANYETTPNCIPISSQTTSTTKAFLNNSLQAVQQKMEDLLPTSQASTSSMAKELPLLSRISNEISANTANTVKVLKRRLSLN